MRTIVAVTIACVMWPVAAALAHAGHELTNAPEHPGPNGEGAGEHVLVAVQDGAERSTKPDVAAQPDVPAKPDVPASPGGISGQGPLRFRVLYTSDHLPGLAQSVIERAHGGFAVDRREGRGEIYFALPEAGILQLSSDFRLVRMLNTPDEVRKTNMHNTTIWYDAEENGYLVFPANDAGRVLTTSLDGFSKHTLGPPSSEMTFDADAVNRYFSKNGKFVPTDVEYVNGKYFITTGYSNLDYVLTAEISVTKPDPAAEEATQGRRRFRRGPSGPSVSAAWTPLAFGGRGIRPGQFGTGHGVTLAPNGTTLAVSDRPNAEIDRFSQSGEYTGTVNLPEGSFPCDVDFEAGYAVVGCLHGPDRSKGAPIYILKDDKVVSTIMPKEDLGLKNFQHIHNAVLVEREGKLFIIAQAWNPGDFAILEQVIN